MLIEAVFEKPVALATGFVNWSLSLPLSLSLSARLPSRDPQEGDDTVIGTDLSAVSTLYSSCTMSPAKAKSSACNKRKFQWPDSASVHI